MDNTMMICMYGDSKVYNSHIAKYISLHAVHIIGELSFKNDGKGHPQLS